MPSRSLRAIFNPNFGVVVILFVICILLHYPQQLLMTGSPSVFSFLGLNRHAVERILLLFPVIYTLFAFGTRAGVISLAVAVVIMLPRVFLISEYFADSLLESTGVIIIGSLVNLWVYRYRKDRQQRQEMLAKLESAYRDLEDRTRIIEEDKKRLAVLNRISGTLAQSLELYQILDAAVASIIDLTRVDGAWICLLSREGNELLLAAHRHFPEGLPRIKLGSGLSGCVAETGQALILEDVSKDPSLPDTVKEKMCSAAIVPLRSKGKVNGTLGVNSLTRRSFQPGEIELLTTIGDQIGVAVDNARLYERQQEVLEELRISEERYRELFENAHDAIWVHDLEGNLVAANKASEKLTGYSSKELLKMNVRRFLSEESLALAKRIRQMLYEGQAVEQPYEQCLIRRDGSQAIVKLTSNLLTEDGKPTGFLHIARDVTVEKEMQDKLSAAYRELNESFAHLKESQQQVIQAEKLASLGQLAASVAHEVNNPLSGVLVYTQLLIKKIKSNDFTREKLLECLGKMESELARSTKLIRCLSDFGRQSPPAFRQLNLNEVLNRSFDIVARSVTSQSIQVKKLLDPSLPALIGDFDQLQQVCTALIGNAIEAMPEGGILTLRTSAGKDEVMVEVRDTGCGIPPENMSKLFTPFFTTKREVKGVGLGLAVAYGIVQRHNGRIDVQSKVGEGSTFTLRLPLRFKQRECLEPAGNGNVASASGAPGSRARTSGPSKMPESERFNK